MDREKLRDYRRRLNARLEEKHPDIPEAIRRVKEVFGEDTRVLGIKVGGHQVWPPRSK